MYSLSPDRRSRFRGHAGKHLLILRLSASDPERLVLSPIA
jgi:hypothetical protein